MNRTARYVFGYGYLATEVRFPKLIGSYSMLQVQIAAATA